MITHERHDAVQNGVRKRSSLFAQLTELGFPRVVCALGFSMDDARATLAEFIQEERPLFIPCDLRALDGPVARTPRKTTDIYLAELAAARGWKLVTLDTGIEHRAAELIGGPLGRRESD